jgi:hypothetical protein
MVMVLRGIVRGDLLPTMPVHQRPGESLFRVVDGLHRFYASKALGFTHLPVSVVRYFDISDPNC